MSEYDRSCVFSREPQLYDVRYPPGKHFTVKGVLTFIHLGPSRRDDEPLDALCCANLYGDAEKMAVLRRGRSGSENSTHARLHGDRGDANCVILM